MQYLCSVRALCNDEKYKRMEKLVAEFKNGIGKKLQWYLILKSWWAANYVSTSITCGDLCNLWAVNLSGMSMCSIFASDSIFQILFVPSVYDAKIQASCVCALLVYLCRCLTGGRNMCTSEDAHPSWSTATSTAWSVLRQLTYVFCLLLVQLYHYRH